MDDLFDEVLHDLKKGDKETLLQEIKLKSKLVSREHIQVLFALTDAEMADSEIATAIQTGEARAALFASKKIYEAAENGEKWAILKLFDMNNGKKRTIANRIVGYQNMNGEVDWEKIKEVSDFN